MHGFTTDSWGEHKKILAQALVPAGKALNISKALDWLKVHSTAAGLWGRIDCQQMLEVLAADYPYIRPSFTVAAGKTRTNLTVVDTRHRREMHLRAECRLAGHDSLRQLAADLNAMDSTGLAVFAGF
ncbi:MAG: hypothetical protein ISS71_04390 [Phycisphaerae bacterium]|nr:hypothetical protein [Phycisphaerae bacterium]